MIFYTTLECDYNFDENLFDKQKGMYIKQKQETPYYLYDKKVTYSISFCVNYALYLLNTKESESIKHACAILNNIFKAQIKDIKSDFYGVWLYDFYDTPDEFVSPDYIDQPDIISALMEIYLEFADYLPQEIITGIKDCCCRSAFAIAQHNHEIDSSTSLLEILSLISAGEQFDKVEYINFSIAKLQTLLYYTLYNDAYMEYNYPGKILIFLEAIKFFQGHIKNHYCLSSIKSIEKVLLTCFYSHFHPKLRQWTGPVSSAAFDFFPKAFIKRIQNITMIKNWRNFKVPAEYYELSPISGEKFTQLLVTRGFSYPHWKFPTVASFYNHPEFSLGSFNRDDMWNLRKSLIAYFGDFSSVYCLRLRCLLNGHDFSSATLHTVQHKGSVLGHITFSTNRGNYHIIHDHEQSFKMTDLRVRFQITGNSSALECANTKNSISVFYKQLSIYFSVGYASFGNNPITYQLTSTSDSICFDTIFYSGEEKELNLSNIKEAILQFSLLMTSEKEQKPISVSNFREDKFLISDQKTPDVYLKLKTPLNPDIIEYTTLKDRQYINNVRLERHVDSNKKMSGQYRFIAESNLSSTAVIHFANSDESKEYLTKIKNLNKIPLDKIDKKISELLGGLDNFSLDIARRYSIHIIAGLFDSAKKSDVRFKNLIELKYSQIYDEISYAAKINKMKKIITDLTTRLQHDLKKLLTNTKKSNKIAKVIQIINNEYSNPDLSLQAISERLEISQAHLSREFHATIGSNYVAFLLKVRMEHAKKMLADGKNIKEIMAECQRRYF